MSNGAQTRQKRSRQKILAAAERIFLKNGFLGTNMDAVADLAGMSKQTVYTHFKSKEALFIQVVIAMTGVAAHALKEDIEEPLDDRPVRDFLQEAATEQLLVVMTPQLMQLRRMVIGEAQRFPELGRTLYQNGPATSIRRYARVFAHYTDLGQLHTPDPIMAATHFNWLLMGGPTSAAMLLGDAGIPDKTALKRHAAESVTIFLSAFSNAKRNGVPN